MTSPSASPPALHEASALSASATDRLRRHFRDRVARYMTVLVGIALLGIWQLLVSLKALPAILLPDVRAVLAALPALVSSETFPKHLLRTVGEFLLGFGIAGVSAILVAFLLSAYPLLRRAYFPLLAVLGALPIVIFAPVVISWLGFGIASKIATAAIYAFYPIFIATLSGLEAVSADAVRLMRSLRASQWQLFWNLRVPTALPVIFGGLKVGLSSAIIGATVAELIGSNAGLGYLLLLYQNNFDMATVFALILVFVAIGVTSLAILELIEGKIVYWRS